MKKTIVIYYSNTGSNRFLANKIAEDIQCDIAEIRPVVNSQLLFMMGIGFGKKKLSADLTQYDRVILCGPVWVGKFVLPLKTFVNKYLHHIKELVFVTCCGSDFEMKDKKFGHGLVFQYLKEMVGKKCTHCEALPVTLVLPDSEKENPDLVMKTRLSDSNFKGEIREVYDKLIENILK